MTDKGTPIREQELLARITELEAENAFLRARIAELEQQLSKLVDSHDSTKTSDRHDSDPSSIITSIIQTCKQQGKDFVEVGMEIIRRYHANLPTGVLLTNTSFSVMSKNSRSRTCFSLFCGFNWQFNKLKHVLRH
jgi:hypothetical protein